MDSPPKDIVNLILRHLNITSKYQLSRVNRFWRNFIKKREWKCNVDHDYHCRLCTSYINNRYGCCNPGYIGVCKWCEQTFCKHLKTKKCKKCNTIYDKNPQVCGMCTVKRCKCTT